MIKRVFVELMRAAKSSTAGLCQLSFAIEINGEIRSARSYRIRPEGFQVDKEYLKINGITDDPNNYELKYHEGCQDMLKTLDNFINPFARADKAIIIGWGVDDQYKALRQYFYDCGNKFFNSYFSKSYIDLKSLAVDRLVNEEADISLDPLSESELANSLGISTNPYQNECLHRLELSILIYKYLNHASRSY